MSNDYEYEISVKNTFTAENPVEALDQMISWLQEAMAHTGYNYENLNTGEHGFIDADDNTVYNKGKKARYNV